MIRLNLTAEVERPNLRVSLSGQNVVLSWPTNAVGFVLETTDRLAPATWDRVSSEAVVTGDRYSLRLPLRIRGQFYRLNAP